MLSKVLSKLQRPVASGSVIMEIEGLRFLAITSVLALHMGTQILRINPSLQTEGDYIYWATENASYGVNLFFAISGFILAYPYARHYLEGYSKMPLRKFYLKRLTRLEPPFIINIILLFFFHILLLHEGFFSLLPHFFSTLTYSHVIIYGMWSNINPVTWSLETEIQFYLLAPFIFFGLYSIKKRYVRVVLLAFVIGFVCFLNIKIGTIFRAWHLHKSLIAFLNYFLTGVLFLELYMWTGFKTKLKFSFLWDLLAIMAVYCFFEVAPRILFWEDFLASVSIFVLLTGAFKGRLLNVFFRLPVVTIIGGMCYTIYLYHYAIFFGLSKYTVRIPVPSNKFWIHFLVQGVFLIAAVLIISGLFFYLLEIPFMAKSRNRSKSLVGNTISEITGG